MSGMMDYPAGLSLSGAAKVAVLVLALGEEQGAKLVALLQEDEVREVSAAMAQLGSVKAETVEALCASFLESVGSTGMVAGSFETTERLLLKSMPPDRVNQIMEEIRGPAGKTLWDKLGNVNEQVLATYLKNEYPQTIAVVLSRIKSDHAGRVLAILPEPLAIDVIERMLTMDGVQKEVLEDIENTLRVDFMSSLGRSTRRDLHEQMADIFNSLDRQSEARFMAALEARSESTAARIKALMFTFEDLARLSPPAIQALLRQADKEALPLALKGASEKLRELFFKNLSERAGKMLREDIDGLGPVRLRDVDAAQAALVATAKEMAATGEIEITSGKEDDLLY
jgi:flagellar motor switch protein FliG